MYFIKCSIICVLSCSFIVCSNGNLLSGNMIDTDNIGFKKDLFSDLPHESNNMRVDPNDMRNYLHGSQSMRKPGKVDKHTQTGLTTSCEKCLVHMQRFVSLFLRAAGLKDYTSNRPKKVALNLIITPEELKFLQTFTETDDSDLSNIDMILTDIFTPSETLHEEKVSKVGNDFGSFETESSFLNSVINAVASIGSLLCNSPEMSIALGVVSVFSIALWQVLYSKTYKASIFCLLFIIFGSGYGWTWVRLYKEADIKRFTNRVMNNNEVPLYCRPQDMSWYHYLFYSFNHEKRCEEYFKLAMIEPILEVSPLIVLAETASSFILYPAQKVGFAIGGFITALMDSIPWPYKYFVVPIIIILAVVIIVVITTLTVGGRIMIKIPFSSFELSSLFNNAVDTSTQRNYIEHVPEQKKPIRSTETTGKIISPEAIEERKKFQERFKIIMEGGGDVDNFVEDNNTHLHLHLHVPGCSGEGSSQCCKEDTLPIESKEKLETVENKDSNNDSGECSDTKTEVQDEEIINS